MKTFYSNLRIKHKVFVLISFVLFAFCAGSLAVLQYAFDVYNKEIYRQSAQALSVSIGGIENELTKMEKLSFRIDTDTYVQSYMADIKDSSTVYERFVTGMNLRERMLEIGGLEKYVLSLQMIDVYGNEYATGNKTVVTPAARLRQIEKEAAAQQGGVKWIFPDESDPNALIAAREVRSYTYLSLVRLGTLAIRVDLNGIFSDFSRGLDKDGTSFMIFNGGRLVYPEAAPLSPEDVKQSIAGRSGYKLTHIDGKRYFVTYAQSRYTDWIYMIVTPYDSIFQVIVSVRKAVLGVLAVLFVIVMFLSVRFARGITGPIESLNMKMKKVRLGNFEYADEPEDRLLPQDEAGQMHRNFKIMLQRINELITENYKKQLVIKESEFKALQAQINPHFLYNTLELINWSAKMSGQHHISRMAEALGFLLRSSISRQEPLVTLEYELKIVEHYVAIQKYRYEERLVFHLDIPSRLLDCKIPKLTLQPLVENAIRYGLEKQIGTCEIAICGNIEQDRLVVCVRDNGPGMDEAILRKLQNGEVIPKGTGIGLRNIEERIKLLFGDAYGIRVESGPGEGTAVWMSLPVERSGQDVQSAAGG